MDNIKTGRAYKVIKLNRIERNTNDTKLNSHTMQFNQIFNVLKIIYEK